MLAVIRLKGGIGFRKAATAAMKVIGLKTTNSVVLLPNTPTNRGLVRSVENFVAWGEASEETKAKIGKVKRLHPPKKGFRSLKQSYPRGDLGYRGEKINELIARMSE
jgi:ribosomal protein L30/L7E